MVGPAGGARSRSRATRSRRATAGRSSCRWRPRARRVADRAPDAAQERLIRGIERLRRAVAAGYWRSALADSRPTMDAAAGAPRMFFESEGGTGRTGGGGRRG